MTGITMNLIPKLVCLLMIVAANLVSSNDVQSILSKLYNRAVDTNRPLVVVLDNSQRSQSQQVPSVNRAVNRDVNRGVNRGSSLSHKLIQYSPLTKLQSPHAHSVHHPLQQNRESSQQYRSRYQNHASSNRQDSSEASALQILYLLKELQVRESVERQRQQQTSLLREQNIPNVVIPQPLEPPSPIVKHLLRLRNSLRCGKRAECENSCDKKEVTKKYTCTKKCASKYICEEQPPPPPPSSDDCDEDDGCETQCDSCEDTRTLSTKALQVIQQENDTK